MSPRRLSLAGTWSIRPEEGGNGAAAAAWRPIELPCAWQTVLGPAFHGRAVLRREVTVPQGFPGPGGRAWLRFESAATALQARVNGVAVGGHVGDWVPFQLEVNRALRPGRINEIELAVDEMAGAHICKGFHDVLSAGHGGVWQGLDLAATGSRCAAPDGVAVRADPATGAVTVEADLEPGAGPGRTEVTILDPGGAAVASGAGDRLIELRVPSPRRWSPRDPALYTARIVLVDEGGPSEHHERRFGFRSVATRGETVLLNGEPLFIRGVLDWGHEPQTIAPAPPPEVVRARFERLRAMGFNLVCLCMWYPPRHFYEIADETGMLLWQEHPVWQAPMPPESLAEYRRLYAAFLRRDRAHPSVIVVSATCEHPRFDPSIAEWWWRESARELPGTLRQVQTASFAWMDPLRTDLWDEHTYESPDRWVPFLADLRAHRESLAGPRPFVMGETVAFTSWPDVAGLRARCGNERPAWLPRAFAHMAEVEAACAPLRPDGDRFHLLGRKFEVEQFRRDPGNAGLVMNHLRDVPACQCGFMDDLGRWRFAPEQTRGWLGDRALILETPDQRRGFAGGRDLACTIALSNFGAGPVEGRLRVRLGGAGVIEAPLRCAAGDVARAAFALALPAVAAPARLTVTAGMDRVPPNAWDLWVFPAAPPPWPPGARRLEGLPFTASEREPDEAERGYSRGFGLPARSWSPRLPDPALLAPELPPWRGPGDGMVLLAHRLTREIVRWVGSGGRVVLLASKAAGALGARYEWLFGQVPLVFERAALRPGDGAWIGDLLLYDLVRRHARVIPVEDLGIAGEVEPLVRNLYTHDQREKVRIFDQLLTARAGEGLIVATSLDHHDDAGRFLLRRLVAYGAEWDAASDRRPQAPADRWYQYATDAMSSSSS